MRTFYKTKAEAETSKAKMVKDKIDLLGRSDWTFEVRKSSDESWYIIAFDNQGEYIGVM